MKRINLTSIIKPNFLIAEISGNHCGNFINAKKLILLAKKSGFSAVKLQTYTPATMTLDSDKKWFKIKSGLWKGYNFWDLYENAHTPFEWHLKLFNYAKKIGIVCFSTPFDETAVDLLESLDCPFYKIASFEMNHLPLIKKVARTKKIILISTGMANLEEIDLTYRTAKANGAKEIILLYCVSNYPSKLEDFNFNNIKILKNRYKCKVGFSDHSNDNRVVECAIAAGAEVIEKHLALEGQNKSPDISFSLKGKKIKEYVDTVRNTYKVVSKDYFFVNKSEYKNRIFRRSLYATRNIRKGERFTKDNIKIIRPGYGIDPLFYEKLLKKKSPIFISGETPITPGVLSKLKIKK